MMKNKTTKAIVNGVVLAAMAGLGITAYQLGTTSLKKEEVKEAPVELVKEGTENTPLIETDAGQSTAADDTADLGTGTEILGTAGADEVDESAAVSSIEGTEAAPDNGTDGLTDGSETADAVSSTDIVNDLAESDLSVSDWTDGTGVDPYAGAAAKYAPEINFSEDTLMEWPVNGTVLVDYSMDQTTYFPTLDQYKLSPAIAVQAVEGAPVVAAVNGTVYSIEENAQTGTTVTMELGNGYQAIYGQLTDLAVQEGETIKKGTTIGYIGTPTKYYSKEGTNLYYAMKKDGDPIDPIAYLP